MRFSLALFVSVFVATSLAAVEEVSHPQMDLLTRQWNCGQINGNCYDNGCGGEYSRDGVTCTTGQYAGCECGYNCGPVNGACWDNGCDGYNGRCTNNYRGCTCNQY